MADADPLSAALEPIRERVQRATPGPWAWRGNIDNGDPYLTSLGRREVTRPDGTVRRHHAGDVLGHIPVEVTRAEAIRRGVGHPDSLPEPNVDRDPVGTYDKRYDSAIEAARDAEIESYLTDDYGNPRTEPRLAFCTDWMYEDARKLVTFEVAPGVTDREDPRVYRADITGIQHPDAVFIAAAREDISRLLAAVNALAVAHAPVQLYQWHEGGDCGHPEPEDDTSEAWGDWDGEHPSGEGLDGYDDQRICLVQPLGKPVCRACTELVRSVTGDDTAEVSADECIVRPVLAAHLAKEAPNA